MGICALYVHINAGHVASKLETYYQIISNNLNMSQDCHSIADSVFLHNYHHRGHSLCVNSNCIIAAVINTPAQFSTWTSVFLGQLHLCLQPCLQPHLINFIMASGVWWIQTPNRYEHRSSFIKVPTTISGRWETCVAFASFSPTHCNVMGPTNE